MGPWSRSGGERRLGRSVTRLSHSTPTCANAPTSRTGRERRMFVICVIAPTGRSALLKRGTLFEARETAREAALVTGHAMEIINATTGAVVERHEPPKLPELGSLSRPDGTQTRGRGQRRPATRAQELRRKATLARQAARVPTSGCGRANRVLVAVAERLELEASALKP